MSIHYPSHYRYQTWAPPTATRDASFQVQATLRMRCIRSLYPRAVVWGRQMLDVCWFERKMKMA